MSTLDGVLVSGETIPLSSNPIHLLLAHVAGSGYQVADVGPVNKYSDTHSRYSDQFVFLGDFWHNLSTFSCHQSPPFKCSSDMGLCRSDPGGGSSFESCPLSCHATRVSFSDLIELF